MLSELHRKGKTSRRSGVVLLMLLLLVAGAAGCRRNSQGAERLAEDSVAAQRLESNLTFNNITLEQADEQGQTLWKVDAEQATYSPDQKVAQVVNPDGELFQDGEPIFRIQALRGEVKQDGKRIVLQGEIVATDIQSGAVLKGDELEWKPQEDLLIVRNNLEGTHPQLQATASEARVSNRTRRMVLQGPVTATATDPNLRLQAERLIWLIDDEQVKSEHPVQVERLENNRVTDRATGETAEVDLASKIVRLMKNAQVALVEPPVQVTSEILVWNLEAETLSTDRPLRAVHRQQQVNLTANQGRMDLARNIFYLTGNVRAIGQRNRSDLAANNLTWTIPTQQVEATGDVVYSQADPAVTLRGPRAVGRFENQTVVVSGGRVVTEIIP